MEEDSKSKEDNNADHSEPGKLEKGIKSILELFDLLITYIKEQSSKVLHENLFAPLNRFRISLIQGIVAAFLFGIAAIFAAIAFVLLLMEFFAPWASYAIIAAILIALGVMLIRGNNES